MPTVASPCIRLCVIDPVSGLCAGCGRTLTEIGNWLRYSDGERRALMDILPGRLATAVEVPTPAAGSHR